MDLSAPLAVARDDRLRVSGRYRLDRLLAIRPRVEIWRAVDERLGRPVAVHLVRADTDRQLDELATVVRRLSRLQDDRLTRILDLDVAGPYVVTEWVPGQTLSMLLAAGRLSTGLAVELIAETADALATAHAGGVQHRHLTADSIVWSQAGLVKVLGTGLDAVLQHQNTDDDPGNGELADTRALGRLLRRLLPSGSPDPRLHATIRRALGEPDLGAPILTPADLVVALEPCRGDTVSLRRHHVRPALAEAPPRPVPHRVWEVMNTDVVTVTEDTPVRELAAVLARTPCRAVPVVDGHGRVTGLISATDLARWQPETVK
ncbi:CBS domain-containing protein [Kribbella sindirgiensis]|uniref:CBS domain-containing protein n=1 Tax=Kribbella sindirgiensis TaxID=1124744 RepID=A0A4R0I4Q5_9ACTN|nr:CBS domain-containing protein [Kribbella sindirgiensis]TCC21598.1 CBS domain-containing protein [Kribbella sindirgiensis]